MAENVSRLMIEVTSDGVIKAADNLDELTTSGKRSEVQAEKTARGIKKIDKAATATKGSFGAMKGATQNISYQLQDVAVQAQMGTSAFIILGQQGPQLASSFGPGGAVFGALLAFGSMIGGVLYASMNKAKVSSDDLKDALIRLDDTAIKSKNSTYELSKRILELANVSSKGAQAELISGIQDTTDVIKGAQTSIEKLIEAESGMRFGGLASGLERLKKKELNIEDLLKIGGYDRSIMELNRFAESVEHLQKTYKITVPQAFSLAEAMGSVDPKDASTYTNLRNTIDDIASVSGLSSVEFKRFRQSVVEGANSINDMQKKATLLGTALGIVKESGATALAPLVEGAAETSQSLIDLENVHRNSLLDMDQRELDAAIAKEERANLFDARQKAREDARLVLQKEAAQKRLDTIMVAGATEYEAIKLMADQKTAKLKEDYANELIDAQQFADAKAAIEKTALDDSLSYRLASEQAAYQTAGAFAGKVTSLMSSAFGEQSAAAKAAYVVQQGLAIAQTIVATEMAAITAGAQSAVLGGIPGFLASAGMVKAMGYASVAIIAAQTIGTVAGGRALGGQVRGGESYLVGERGPELLTMGTSGRIATNENLKNAVGGGGGVTVINNIDATGSGPDVETKIKAAMDQTSAKTIATIQDLMRRRRFA